MKYPFDAFMSMLDVIESTDFVDLVKGMGSTGNQFEVWSTETPIIFRSVPSDSDSVKQIKKPDYDEIRIDVMIGDLHLGGLSVDSFELEDDLKDRTNDFIRTSLVLKLKNIYFTNWYGKNILPIIEITDYDYGGALDRLNARLINFNHTCNVLVDNNILSLTVCSTEGNIVWMTTVNSPGPRNAIDFLPAELKRAAETVFFDIFFANKGMNSCFNTENKNVVDRVFGKK